jgi:hypothetical protein
MLHLSINATTSAWDGSVPNNPTIIKGCETC